MSRDDQARILRELMDSVYQDVNSKIKSGRIPEEWDGHELRQLISDKFKAHVGSMMEGRNHRRREYENAKLIYNL